MINSVELTGYYGGDLNHALSAWTSTSRDLTQKKIDRIPKMLSDLAKNGHHTPFEKSAIQFLVSCDKASEIHLLKHRIGVSINAESARYKEFVDETIHIPEDWPKEWQEKLRKHTEEGNRLYHESIEALEPILDRPRSKESGRYFKTMNNQVKVDIMFNWRSFAHFLSLRNKPEAQKEIRDIAQQMLDLVKQIEGNPFQHTIIAFNL